MKGVLALPAMRLLCMCSMLVPSEFAHSRKRDAKNLHFGTFPGSSCISESAKKLQTVFSNALNFSFDNSFFFWFLFGWLLRRPPKTLKWPYGYAQILLVHIRCPPSAPARIHTHTHTHTHKHTDTQTHRHTDTQTHRHTDTQTHRHTHTHTQTQTQRDTRRRTQTHADTHPRENTHTHTQTLTDPWDFSMIIGSSNLRLRYTDTCLRLRPRPGFGYVIFRKFI